jgi:hypothetical protein
MTETQIDELVRRTLEGSIALNELTDVLSSDRSLTSEQQRVVHLLVHFATDEDIRASDAEYDNQFRERIRVATNRNS